MSCSLSPQVSILCNGALTLHDDITVELSLLPRQYLNMRLSRKYPSILNIENQLLDLDVTWQPVRGDLTVHPGIVTLPWG
jgi:hypothetical protein